MTSHTPRQIKLGLFLDGTGHHIAAWRDPDVDVRKRFSLAHYTNIARTAERGKFDMLFLADTYATFGPDDINLWNKAVVTAFEPLTLLGGLAAMTERIGLVATMTTTYYEPFSVARFFASLDHLSNGRAGWNLVTSTAAAEAFNFGKEAHPAHADRYARAKEFAHVVMGLWDLWDEDAVRVDKAAGIYFDTAKLHFLNHKGKHFSTRGPLMIPRTPQGRPVIVQAGQSDDGRDLAAETAEVIFTVQQDMEQGRTFCNDIKTRAAAYGRSPDAIKVLPGVMTMVGRTRAEAEDKYEKLQSLIRPEFGIKQLSAHYGMDLTKFPIDGPAPEPTYGGTEHGRAKVMYEVAKRDNLTLRQLMKRVIGQRGHRTVCGSPTDVADALESWFVAGACDGFNIAPMIYPKGLEDFVDLVIPELQRRGLFRKEYEGRTLRENLGLAQPASRYAHRTDVSAAE